MILIYLQRKSRRYYPTRLAITLSAGITTNSSTTTSAIGPTPGTGDSGFIVVETNYRIYAYTSKYSYDHSFEIGSAENHLLELPMLYCSRGLIYI